MNDFKSLNKIIYILGETSIFIATGIVAMIVCFAVFVYAAAWLWPGFYGSYSLGSNIYMLEWDGGGYVIVQGSNIHGNTCYGGNQLIPTYENQYDSAGNFAEYVVDAKSDDNWVVAKTDNNSNHQRKFYLIDKKDIEHVSSEEILNHRIACFSDSTKYVRECKKRRIRIKL